MARTDTVTSFPVSAVAPGQLGPILEDYLALERLKVSRRLLMKRFGVLAVVVGAWAQLTGLLTPLASMLALGTLIAVPGVAWAAELRAELRLTRRLSSVPHNSVDLSQNPPIN